MQITNFLRGASQSVIRHSPAILTGLGASGLVATAYLASKASMDVGFEIGMREAKYAMEGDFTHPPYGVKNALRDHWRMFIPAAAVGTASLVCIIGATTIANRRQAALVGLVTVSERALTEYREQVAATLGEQQETRVRDAVAQKHIDDNPKSEREVIIASGETLFYDELTGRYFKNDMETVRKAVNDINFQCINDMYASQNEFYSKIGLPSIKGGDDIGWNTDKPLELVYSATITEDGKAAIHLGYRELPFVHFAKPW